MRVLRGGSLSSSSSSSATPRNSDEHIIQIPNLEAELHSHQQSVLSHSHSPPRRRVQHPNPTFDPKPTDISNNSHQPRRYRHRITLPFGCGRCSKLHAIPLLILFCFFLLWWFSSPVNVAVKDGRIIEHTSILRPFSLNDTELNLSRDIILAVATSPNPNIELILPVTHNAGDVASPRISSN